MTREKNSSERNRVTVEIIVTMTLPRSCTTSRARDLR